MEPSDTGNTESGSARPEFIEYRDTRPRWFIPLVLIAIAIAVAVVVGIFVRISVGKFVPVAWIPFSIFALAIVLLGVLVPLSSRQRTIARITEKREAKIDELLPLLLSSPWQLAGRDQRTAMKALIAQGRRNVVARVSRKEKSQSLNPLTEVFEPVPVDESVSLFVALERDDDQNFPQGLPATDMDQRDATRKFKRNMTLAGGFGMVFLFGFNAIMAAFESWQSKRIHPNLIMWTAWLVVAFFGFGGRGAYSWKQQWMLVPGGIVSRRLRMFRSATELHLFKRTESVLIAQAAQQKLWAVHVADAGASQMARMTAREAHLLLRAWLSPIPPPPIEQLTDLRE